MADVSSLKSRCCPVGDSDVTNKLQGSVRGKVFKEAEERNKPSPAKTGLVGGHNSILKDK